MGNSTILLTDPSLVQFSSDGYFAETGKTLCQRYEGWLDEGIRQFRAVEEWMRAGATLQEIKTELRERVD